MWTTQSLPCHRCVSVRGGVSGVTNVMNGKVFETDRTEWWTPRIGVCTLMVEGLSPRPVGEAIGEFRGVIEASSRSADKLLMIADGKGFGRCAWCV